MGGLYRGGVSCVHFCMLLLECGIKCFKPTSLGRSKINRCKFDNEGSSMCAENVGFFYFKKPHECFFLSQNNKHMGFFENNGTKGAKNNHDNK